jgi:uncharacterized protein (TIGR03083 family)
MTGPASAEEVRAMVAGELADLADTVAGFTDDQWDAPTLCAGWRVREVIAHITMPTRMSSVRFFAELARDRGNVNRMADRFARRDAALPTSELVEAMRSDHLRRWTPPGGGGRGALVHAVIHGLDITEALALDRTVPLDRLRVVLSEAVQPKSTKFFGLDVDGLRIEATDLDWASGEGSVVRAPGHTVALVLGGRPVPPGSLSGAGASQLTGSRA